jgi:hypothetical protein
MDVGICMRPDVLEHKLEARHEQNPEEAWNLARWPNRLSEPGDHRLFVAAGGAWRGYFTLSPDALYNPDDPRAPFTLLFDTRTWTPIPSVPVKQFRGFTYKVPPLANETGTTTRRRSFGKPVR